MIWRNSLAKWVFCIKMKRKYILLLTTLIILFSNCSTQKDLDYLMNKNPDTQRDSIINENFCLDSSLIEQYRHCFAFDIYLFGGNHCNCLSLNTNVIDTSKFNIDYFAKKDFIKDFIRKDKKNTDAVIQVESSYLYNPLTNHTQTFDHDMREWYHKKGQLKTHLYDCFPQGFYDLIGSLLYNNTLDYVFAYPTHVHYSENIIGTELGMYFGVKGKKVYIIIDNWTSENQGNDPQIIPVEDYLDCCWEKMTNVLRK